MGGQIRDEPLEGLPHIQQHQRVSTIHSLLELPRGDLQDHHPVGTNRFRSQKIAPPSLWYPGMIEKEPGAQELMVSGKDSGTI
jgi:hypothetical protein